VSPIFSPHHSWPARLKPAEGFPDETSTCGFLRLCTSARNIGTVPDIIFPTNRDVIMLKRRDEPAAIIDRPYNNLLRRLGVDDYALIAEHLTSGHGAANELLYNPGDNVNVVHFPCGPSLATFLVTNADGRDVETILVGREGAVGGIVSEGFLPAYTRIVVKFGGPFVHLPVDRLDAAKVRSRTLRNVFTRYADCLLAQIFQSTACNAIHSIEQRTAKWIISAMERTDAKEVVPLTHEQLATLLGVGRSYASRVIQIFKAEGILETRRGAILVRDRDGLQARACLCNESIKIHFEEVLRGVYPTKEDAA
jgi:Crp-like helix-turn-helix domain